jgi:mono/diheme cytochrome c family protein
MRPTLVVLIAMTVVCGSRIAAAQDASAERGRPVYEKWCTPCHGSGEGKPGTISAAALYKGARPAVLAERMDLTAAGIKTAVRKGAYIMPMFRKTEVTDADLEALVSYLTRREPGK